MDIAVEPEAVPDEEAELERVTTLLGGPALLQGMPRDKLEAHELLMNGIPGEAWWHLVDSLHFLPKTGTLEKAVGISLRTLQRRRGGRAEKLSREQSGRVWRFAEILDRVTRKFGSQEEAERWLEHPAMGLNRYRPIDLLATPAGRDVVSEFLTRLEYGVYT